MIQASSFSSILFRIRSQFWARTLVLTSWGSEFSGWVSSRNEQRYNSVWIITLLPPSHSRSPWLSTKCTASLSALFGPSQLDFGIVVNWSCNCWLTALPLLFPCPRPLFWIADCLLLKWDPIRSIKYQRVCCCISFDRFLCNESNHKSFVVPSQNKKSQNNYKQFKLFEKFVIN